MHIAALVQARPINSRILLPAQAGFWLWSLVFSLGNLALPLALHQIPQAGPMFLPLFFFTLIAAWRHGLVAGLLVALASPLINHLLVGMPTLAMLPVVLAKSLGLALAASLLAGLTRSISLGGTVLAVVAMQAIGFAAERLAGLPLPVSGQLFLTAVPGMLILAIGGYALLSLLNKSGLDRRQE